VLNLSLVACSNSDVCNKVVEVKSLLKSVEECFNIGFSVVMSFVIDAVDDNVNGSLELVTVETV
jgi:hypothetical protein